MDYVNNVALTVINVLQIPHLLAFLVSQDLFCRVAHAKANAIQDTVTIFCMEYAFSVKIV
jgi:hypothetical protein